MYMYPVGALRVCPCIADRDRRTDAAWSNSTKWVLPTSGNREDSIRSIPPGCVLRRPLTSKKCDRTHHQARPVSRGLNSEARVLLGHTGRQHRARHHIVRKWRVVTTRNSALRHSRLARDRRRIST